MKRIILAALAMFALAAPAAAQVTTYDTTPSVAFTYGAGNGYAPANAAVLTNGDNQLALRAHVPGDLAASTGGTGIYTFNIGSAVSFDYSIFGSLTGANVLLTNLLTGNTAFFNPITVGGTQLSGALQNSEQLGFGFLNGTGLYAGCCGNLHFDPSINNTYKIDLTSGGQTLTAFAQVGTGAVPEPATWAMMLIGFGAMGVSLRRRRRTNNLLQAA